MLVRLVMLLRMFGMKIATANIMAVDPAMMRPPMSGDPDVFIAEIPIDRPLVIGLVSDRDRDPDFAPGWSDKHPQEQQANQSGKFCFHTLFDSNTMVTPAG